MKALLQRVTSAHVRVDQTVVSSIGSGILVFVAIIRGDGEDQANWLANKIVSHRIFPRNDRPMDLSVVDTEGEILIVSQFTLAASTTRGNRPDFSKAETPERARYLFEHFVDQVRALHSKVSVGAFGANMQVSLVNDGPVTILLHRDGQT